MIKTILRIPLFFVLYLAVCVITKFMFMAVYLPSAEGVGASDWLRVIYHGLPMDCSISAYLTIIPAILTIVSVWTSSKFTEKILRVYIAITAILTSVVTIADIALYSYWHFRIDATPIFYFMSSPSAAMASATWSMILTGIISVIVLSVAIFFFISRLSAKVKPQQIKKKSTTALAIVLTASLIIPIRGSVTVSTMNLSRAYFCSDLRLNHAAINPMFSLIYSLSHQANFSSQFRFMTSEELDESIASIKQSYIYTDSIAPVLLTDNPDIYIIILESFSDHLMPSLGGEPIATGLDSIASASLVFPNFYASGARTDRAIPAILGAFPAQPTTSLMKYSSKIEHLPAIPSRIKQTKPDYKATYYYGGDANFTNQLAYLVSAGFDKVVSDKDFSPAQRRSKWGAHDDLLFKKVLQDIDDTSDNTPNLRVIQTSSSHEPFDVPFSDPRFADDIRKNAFAFTDSCVTDFINKLHASGRWNNSLIFITADHYGVHPQNLTSPLQRHQIPLIITGGAISGAPARINTIGGQTAIAATLLQLLDIDHSDFEFSRSLFDPAAPKFAFFTEPGIAALVTPTDTVVLGLDNNTPQIVPSDDTTLRHCQAILQRIYDKLSEL